jgi:multiple sugar transport system substrate-binding protein
VHKWFGSVSVAAIMAMSPVSAGAVDLTLWAIPSFTPSAGLPAIADAYTDLYARFEAENPDITVKYEVLPGGTEALQQILTAATAGNLPDMAVLDGFWIARLVETGKLQPLNDLWAEESRALLYGPALDAVTFDGKIYAAWFHNAWRGVFYRKDTLAKLGYENPPATWDEFLAMGEAAKAAGMYAYMAPGVASEVTTLHMLASFWGMGGELVDGEGKPVFFDGANRTALETIYARYRQMVERGLMPLDVTTMDEAATRPYFYTGETATTAQSSSSVTQMYADVPDLVGNLGAFNYPNDPGVTAVPILVGWTYGIFAEDAEKQAAAAKFVNFVMKPENLGPLNAAAGHLPVIESIWDQDFYKNDELMQQFKAIFDQGGMRPRPPFPIYPAITVAWASQMADVLAGNITPAQAVDAARDQVMAEYSRLSGR